MTSKFTSRKFWIAVAAFLASLGSSIAGFATQNETLAWVGIICTTLSAAIYAASEAYVDGHREASNTTSVTASSTSKDVVESVLKPESTALDIDTTKIGGTK